MPSHAQQRGVGIEPSRQRRSAGVLRPSRPAAPSHPIICTRRGSLLPSGEDIMNCMAAHQQRDPNRDGARLRGAVHGGAARHTVPALARSETRAETQAETRPNSRAHAARAFTLIELLVVIAIIALLLAIVFPAFGAARRAGWRTKGLVNLRSTQLSFEQYANENSVYPFREPGTPPGDAFGGGDAPPLPPDVLAVRWWPGNVIIATSEHWEHRFLWPAILTPIDDWPEVYPTWVSPGFSTELPEADAFAGDFEYAPQDLVSIRYSNSFVASPKLWATGSDPAAKPDRSLIRAVGQHEVRSPAGKVMLWDGHVAYVRPEPERVGEHYNAPTPMAFADGHVDTLNPLDATEAVANPLNQDTPPTQLHDTPGGVRGIDY
jgi:prepilin-type N-terminal cleavage/methylation domain-containing protein/prepilin-type processing-associated H-X9-DG protein